MLVVKSRAVRLARFIIVSSSVVLWRDKAVTSMHSSSVNVTVRRVGGSFGGKISRSHMVSAAAAVGAWKASKPVKIALNMKTFMTLVGGREPFYSKYKVSIWCGVNRVIFAITERSLYCVIYPGRWLRLFIMIQSFACWKLTYDDAYFVPGMVKVSFSVRCRVLFWRQGIWKWFG